VKTQPAGLLGRILLLTISDRVIAPGLLLFSLTHDIASWQKVMPSSGSYNNHKNCGMLRKPELTIRDSRIAYSVQKIQIGCLKTNVELQPVFYL
jgi:hypothetical protein